MTVMDRAQSLNATSDSGRTHTNFPLTAVCYPGDDLGLHLSYDEGVERSSVERLLSEFKRLLLALMDGLTWRSWHRWVPTSSNSCWMTATRASVRIHWSRAGRRTV